MIDGVSEAGNRRRSLACAVAGLGATLWGTIGRMGESLKRLASLRTGSRAGALGLP
jgi:hypothetical protein